MNADLKLGLVGFGKIARDQHLPAIAQTPGVELVAIATHGGGSHDVPIYPDLGAMLENEPDLDAVVLCQPPQSRFEAARDALLAGKDVFLEKPPGTTLSEVESLIATADFRNRTLFASWHSREAVAVRPAKQWLSGKAIRSVTVTWREDVRVWHPGQTWIWEQGGFGVFDPGINALSILTELIADPVRLTGAELEIPVNCAMPIAARLSMECLNGVSIEADFDFRQTGRQVWEIRVATEAGELVLGEGGNSLVIAGVAQVMGREREYPALYERFAALVTNGKSEVDLAPIRLVADAFLIGKRIETAVFAG